MQAERKKKKTFIKCEICGLRTARSDNKKRKFFTKFPLDPNRCKLWVKVTGKEDLAYVPIEKLHQLKYLCGDHFKPKDFNKKKNRLKRSAVPSINLPAEPLPDEILEAFPLPIYVDKENISPVKAVEEVSLDELQMPGTSKEYVLRHVHETCPGTEEAKISGGREEAIIAETQKKSIFSIEGYPENISPAKTVEEISQDVLQMPGTSKDTSNPEKTCPEISGGSEEAIIAETQKKSIPSIEAYPAGIRSTDLQHALTDHDYGVVMGPADHNYCKDLTDFEFCMSEELLIPERDINVEKEITIPNKLSGIRKCYALKPREKQLYLKLLKNKASLKEIESKLSVIESSPALQAIIGAAARNRKRKPQGRRYTMAEKGVAITIYKKSPKVYRLLNQFQVPLPSERTLQGLLQKFHLEPGVHKTVLKQLQKTIETMKDEDKACALLFDEMTLKKRVIYNTGTDKVEGYVDLGYESSRKNVMAHKVMVMMIQGLRKKYKQPVGHFFVDSALKKEQLAVIIKEMIQEVNNTGLTVKVTVCDQGSNNVGAINLLKQWSHKKETENHFEVDGKAVLIAYDVPHLFKNIRNNFLNSGNIFWDGKIAKMDHIFRLEAMNTKTLHFTKINNAVIRPSFKGKMKVKHAAHLLSNTVQAVIRLMADAEGTDCEKKSMTETADVIKDLDLLFDVSNGPSGPNDVKKNYRENVKKNSFHHQKWIEFKRKLNTAYFFKRNGKKVSVRCLSGYVTTINTLEDIWKYQSTKGLKIMNLRQLNQDSLENMFGKIRQHSPTSPNPTCHHFTAALKASIMSNVCTPSRGRTANQIKTVYSSISQVIT